MLKDQGKYITNHTNIANNQSNLKKSAVINTNSLKFSVIVLIKMCMSHHAQDDKTH